MPKNNNGVYTILIVDDEADLLEIIDFKLKAEGFETLLSLNGEQVWEIITQFKPDIVLLDLHMQGVDGGDICKQIKTDPATCSIPVLIFSANDNVKAIQEDCGADGFITKPFEDNILIKTIHRFLPSEIGT